jgi:hypothetical protein
LYGLKQSLEKWHEKFEKTSTAARFVVNKADKYVCYRYGGGEEVILCLYGNGIHILGPTLM